MWRRVNVISVEKVREEREVGQVWPPAAAAPEPPSVLGTDSASIAASNLFQCQLPFRTKGREEGKGERMEDGEVGRYMLKKGGRDRPTNLENLQLSIGRSRYVVGRAKTKFWSHFYLLHGMSNFAFYL